MLSRLNVLVPRGPARVPFKVSEPEDTSAPDRWRETLEWRGRTSSMDAPCRERNELARRQGVDRSAWILGTGIIVPDDFQKVGRRGSEEHSNDRILFVEDKRIENEVRTKRKVLPEARGRQHASARKSYGDRTEAVARSEVRRSVSSWWPSYRGPPK